MANRYSITSGLASAPSTWDGGLTVPISGDRVLICAGHTVTLDGTFEWGDDSTATVVINAVSTTASIYVQGTLKASRTISSQLTCVGELLIAAAGTLDYGTELDPIPAAHTAKIITNKSATMAHGKYGVSTDGTKAWAGFRMWGAPKTPRTSMSAALSTDTVITVADATGWQVGDILVIGLCVANNSVTSHRYSAISSIVGNTVTISASLGFDSQAGRTVINLTRNVSIKGYLGNLWRSYVSVYTSVANTDVNTIELGQCEINLTGGGSNQWQISGLNLYWQTITQTTDVVKKIYRPVVHDVYSVVGATTTLLPLGTQALVTLFGNQAYSYTIDEPVMSSGRGMSAIAAYSGCSTKITNPHIVRCGFVITCGYSQGPVGVSIVGGWCEGGTSSFVGGSGVSISFVGVTINGTQYMPAGTTISAFGSIQFNNCVLGGSMGLYTATGIAPSPGGYWPILFENCTVPSNFVPTRSASNLSALRPEAFMFLKNMNNNTSSQRIYRKGGLVIRDNATVNRSLSSLAMYSWYSGVPLTHISSVSVAASSSVRLLGYCKFNTAFGTATPPTLTVSGMGITPQVFTCPATADTWFLIDLTVTNPQAYPGKFTLSFSAMSAANTETAAAWFDGLVMDDFVTWARHYGFMYDPVNPVRTVNPITQLSESAAAALTGISCSTGTLTITSPHTIREVYDWMQWYECANRLVPIMTSTDGLSFSLAANLVLNAPLTGTGTLAMPTGTLTNASASTLAITYATGVLVSIAVTGLTTGSRVQLYDVTSGTELYNGAPGTELSLNTNWSADHILRLRVGYCSGLSAKLPIETTGILSNTGASFLVSQVADTVYNVLGIDGSSCTEFTPDYPDLLMNVTDPDGVTSVQRLYAWATYMETTVNGIASMFRGVTATDTSNIVINTSIVNTKLMNLNAAPVIIAGGYLSRTDGSTVIAATSGSIQLDPGKAYVAQGTIDANLVQVNGTAITGSIGPTATEIATAVWNKPVVEMTDKTTIGGYIKKTLLSIPAFLGLK